MPFVNTPFFPSQLEATTERRGDSTAVACTVAAVEAKAKAASVPRSVAPSTVVVRSRIHWKTTIEDAIHWIACSQATTAAVESAVLKRVS